MWVCKERFTASHPLSAGLPSPRAAHKGSSAGTTAAAPSLGCATAWALLHGSEGRAALPGHRAGVSAHPAGMWSGCPGATSQRSSLWHLSRSLQCCACCALFFLPAAELVLLSLPPHSRKGFSVHLIRESSPPGPLYVPPTRVAEAAQAHAQEECLGESCLHKIAFPSLSPGMCFIPRPERPSCCHHVPPAPPQAPPARLQAGDPFARCSFPLLGPTAAGLQMPPGRAVPGEGLSCRQCGDNEPWEAGAAPQLNRRVITAPLPRDPMPPWFAQGSRARQSRAGQEQGRPQAGLDAGIGHVSPNPRGDGAALQRGCDRQSSSPSLTSACGTAGSQ